MTGLSIHLGCKISGCNNKVVVLMVFSSGGVPANYHESHMTQGKCFHSHPLSHGPFYQCHGPRSLAPSTRIAALGTRMACFIKV